MSAAGRLVRVKHTRENRRERRVKTRIPGVLNQSMGVIEDLSLGGCKFRLQEGIFSVGRPVHLKVIPPTGLSTTMAGEVVGVSDDGDTVNIQFKDINSRQFDFLEMLITGRAFRRKKAPVAEPEKKKSGLFSW